MLNHSPSEHSISTSAVSSVGNAVRESDVMLLSCLDNKSYSRAVLRDSNTYLENILFPMVFPWHNTKVSLTRTTPKDIDEMCGVVYVEEAEVSIGEGREGPADGVFGFGKHEMGVDPTKDDHQNAYIYEMRQSSRARGNVTAMSAARRSNDHGQIELAVLMPPPPSIDTLLFAHREVGSPQVLNFCNSDQEEIFKMKAIANGERAQAAASMPLYCESVDGDAFFNPPAFPDSDDDDYEGRVGDDEKLKGRDQEEDLIGLYEHGVETGYVGIMQRERIAKKRRDLVTSCSRRWKISIRVGGSSSRSRLFRSKVSSCDAPNICAGVNCTLKRPMLCAAILPNSVQNGKSVKLDEASKMDIEGLAASLGSYDCRSMLQSASEKSSSAKKKVNVGRTRLLWTERSDRRKDGCMNATPKAGKATYTSIITGRRLDPNAYRRPREVHVGIRLNGHLLHEEIGGESTDILQANGTDLFYSSIARRSARSNLNYDDSRLGDAPSPVPARDSWTDAEINRAIKSNSQVKKYSSPKITRTNKVPCPSAHASLSTKSIDPSELVGNAALQIKRLVKGAPKQRDSDLVTNVGVSHIDVRRNPLLHRKNFEKGNSRRCVATDHGADLTLKHIAPRFACLPLDDGLVRNVCIAPGKMEGVPVHIVLHSVAKNEGFERLCSLCWTGGGGTTRSKVFECVDCGLFVHVDCCLNKGYFFGGDNLLWRCAVCQDAYLSAKEADGREGGPPTAAMKPRRSTTLPSRFRVGQEEFSKFVSRPSPKCTVCPHSGGAMSMVTTRCQGTDTSNKRWVHDICRLYCRPFNDHPVKNGPNLQSINVCSICGTKGDKNNEFASGLAICAAKGCYIKFHPMCAVLSTKVLALGTLSKKGSRNIVDEKIADEIHCKEYTFALAAVSDNEEQIASKPSGEGPSIVPIAFCGLHNPARGEEYYGCLPGGKMIRR